MKKFSAGFLLIVILMLFTGCPTPQTTDTTSISITNVGWYLDNIDMSYWSTAPSVTTHAFLLFYIHYSGSISASDLSSVKVTAPDSWYWTLSASSCTVDSQYNKIGLPYLYEGGYPNSLAIGTYNFEVKLTSGRTASGSLLVPAPNNTTTNGYSKVNTEDISTPSGSTSLVKRATLGTNSNNGTTLTINFTINDSKVYNGYVWFYDSSNNYIGSTTTTFRDGSTGTILSLLNSGSALYTNGTTNTLTLTDSNITYETGKTFSNINKFILVLTDGAQYASQGKYTSFDCRSMAAMTGF